jgi:hypothetical protein
MMSMQKEPHDGPDSGSVKLSIVILNYNSGTILRDCLDSLFAKDLPFGHEVIVPDNASTDNSLQLAFERWGERIRVVRNERNGGFSWGNNKGIALSMGEYVCVLNPDTRVSSDAFVTLVSFMDSHPSAACCGPKVLNSDGSFQLSAKRSIPTPFDAISRALLLSRLFPRSHALARYELTYLDPDRTQPVDASTGCCMMLRRHALESVGLFDDGYFLYCEDVDWFLRAKHAGWHVWYVGSAVIEHDHAYSRRFRKRRAVEDFHDSMIRFHRKHFAHRYPQICNLIIYGAVRARMYALLLLYSLRGYD